MKQQKVLDIVVGIFMLMGFLALTMLAFKVSGLTSLSRSPSFHVTADFNNIGGLKVRAPVTIAGVRVGEVERIQLDVGSFNAKVTLRINAHQNRIPAIDSSASILTEGLLGSNYISITPGFESDEDDSSKQSAHYLREGTRIEKTQDAIILENLIGQLLFSINKKG